MNTITIQQQCNKKKVICARCLDDFDTNQSLLRHMKKKQQCLPNGSLSYLPCNFCSEKLKNKQTLRQHINKMHSNISTNIANTPIPTAQILPASTSIPIPITKNMTRNNNIPKNYPLFWHMKPNNFIKLPNDYIDIYNIDKYVEEFNPDDHNTIVSMLSNILLKDYIKEDITKRNIWYWDSKNKYKGIYLYDDEWVKDMNNLTLVNECIEPLFIQFKTALQARIKLHKEMEDETIYPNYKDKVEQIEDNEMFKITHNRKIMFDTFFSKTYDEYHIKNKPIYMYDWYHDKCQIIKQTQYYIENNLISEDYLDELQHKSKRFLCMIDYLDTNTTNNIATIRNILIKKLSYDPIKHRKMIIENCRRLLSELGDDQSDPNSEVYSDILAITDS
jgi:hypothetical protein